MIPDHPPGGAAAFPTRDVHERLKALGDLGRAVSASVVALVALVIALVVGVWLSGDTHPHGNVNAEQWAAADIENVVGDAALAPTSLAVPLRLTHRNLLAAITLDRASATGTFANLSIVSISSSRVVLSITTPWQHNLCAWIPVTFSGPVNDWPVNFC